MANVLTPQEIQDLSDPIASVYETVTQELVENILLHISSPTTTHTAVWEIQKLSEMGALKRENAMLIENATINIPKDIRMAMEESRQLAFYRTISEMQVMLHSSSFPSATANTIREMQVLYDNAVDKANLVNTTMLQSSLDYYRSTVSYLSEEARERVESKNATQAQTTQRYINETIVAALLGKDTRTQALKNFASKQNMRISGSNEKIALAGFYDKAGRAWTPEAYMSMVIRTTLKNVAVQSTRNLMEENNCSVFQVSSHAGARPLCYDYQGKYYSWDGSAGEIKLGNGRTVAYEPLSVTTYGQAAGLFGINCGHYPIPIVPGVTIPHGADDVQPPEENDRTYAESQKQRAIERQIRDAKFWLAAAKKNGADTEDERKALNKALSKMNDFLDQTGRSRRYDREQIYSFAEKTIKDPDYVKSQFTAAMESKGVAYKPVRKREEEWTEQRIIQELAGPDKTKGSCASVALAYVGQKAGYDIYDFRGGPDGRAIANKSALYALRNIPGIKYYTSDNPNEDILWNTKELLKNAEVEKQY